MRNLNIISPINIVKGSDENCRKGEDNVYYIILCTQKPRRNHYSRYLLLDKQSETK